MREVNFSIPNANKASVGITAALYDRRALDCTSTLPLINSLNHLAYLTTSSGRIRDILTVDGGIERLVCILKEGRSKDMMEMWKWNLAFQCIVNIGVRGSETVRRRVVEADMIPVIATILDNYFQVIEKCKERAEVESRRRCPFGSSRTFSRSSDRVDGQEQRVVRARRYIPPPISIPENRAAAERDDLSSGQVTPTGPAANLSLSSPPERTTFARAQQQQQQPPRTHNPRVHVASPNQMSRRLAVDQPMSATTLQSNVDPTFAVRPVRDADRLPSMPTLHVDFSSRPQSPTTPSGPSARPGSPSNGLRPRRRPSIRHQMSMSGSDDDVNDEEAGPSDSGVATRAAEPVVGIQTDINMQDIVDDDSLSEPRAAAVTLNVPDILGNDDTIDLTHRSVDNGVVTGAATPIEEGRLPFPQTQGPVTAVNAATPTIQAPLAWYGSRSHSAMDRSTPANILAAMPRDDDVLMSLQLLAYVSKYCYLRSYFQKSHLVPRLKVGSDLRLLDPDYSPSTHPGPTQAEMEEDWDNEFVQKPGEEPFNIFPVIEKFTAKPGPSRHAGIGAADSRGDMKYWAGVVMRNLCRKDEQRGGIRQCAYWQCGKWEEYTRQFAKCRRCRRTKYCSKECQKGAWGSHRFWCVSADDSSSAGELGGGERPSRRHHHHHHHHH